MLNNQKNKIVVIVISVVILAIGIYVFQNTITEPAPTVTPIKNYFFKISDDCDIIAYCETIYYRKTEAEPWQILLNVSSIRKFVLFLGRIQADKFMDVVTTPDQDKVIISVCSDCLDDHSITWQFIYNLKDKSQTQIDGNGIAGFSPDKKLILTSFISNNADFIGAYTIVNLKTGKSLGEIASAHAREKKLGNQIADFIKAHGIKIQETFVPYEVNGFSEDSQRLIITTPRDAFYMYQWKFTTNFNGEDLQMLSQPDVLPLQKIIAPTFDSFKSYLEYREYRDWKNEFNSVVSLYIPMQAQNIYRAISASGPWELIWTIKPSYGEYRSTGFKDILLPALAKNIFYKIRAINSAGEEGPDSDVLKVTIPESDVMTATTFICSKGLELAPDEKPEINDLIPIRVPVANSPQIVSETIKGLMNFKKNGPDDYFWINIFNLFPPGVVKLDAITIQNGVAAIKFFAPFEFSQSELSTQTCIKQQIKYTLDQFSSISKVELYWNGTKIFDSPTLAGNSLARFQYVAPPN